MRGKGLLFFVLLSGLASGACPDLKEAKESGLLHGYKVREIATPGIVRAIKYWDMDKSVKGWADASKKGLYLHTTAYRMLNDGKVVGVQPGDHAAIMLFSGDGKCLQTINGTNAQMVDILSDSSGSLQGALK